MDKFENKVAIITGAASGIGYAITEQFIKEGGTVIGADINEASLQNLKEIFGDSFIGVKADVTKEEDHIKIVKMATEKFSKLDYALNVAGGSKPGTIIDQPEEDWRFTIDLVLNSVFLGIKHQGQQMKKQHNGVIINISSLNAHVPMYAGGAYASGKAAVEMLTKNAALELARYNIRVNAILPGLVDTPLTRKFNSKPEIKDAFMERIPMNRPASPEEIAAPSLFLLTEDASYINGTSLVVDGGWEITGYPDLSRFRK
ncbi:SDR family oxidoreductase [Oceanobacillus piezotolerans]|uniref:SDR family oxidoreductase n=1 Tax=Oceanobacillus piezotolerans TaxID=2448030 RepID=A0A498DCW7_9BACI|nr:SDR family oxidoreductase [Oceanobacillus piezotolerans]RLL46817.1 SDR family oxidoreductase [Oceanobacillus piezotolerans]